MYRGEFYLIQHQILAVNALNYNNYISITTLFILTYSCGQK